MPTQIELGVQRNPEAGRESEDQGKPFNLREFLKEVKTEFLKISWPSRHQVANEFFSVLVLVSILTGIIFLLDKVYDIAVNFITGRLF